MKIEIIAIGNEILSGFTINSNAAFISQELLKEGFTVTRHSVLPDDPELLRKGLKNALEENQLVITTGGLGPTCDDTSRKIAAELFESAMHLDQSLYDILTKRYGQNFPTLDNQATVPSKAKILINQYGTAPGLIFTTGKTSLIMLPGVPLEMKALFVDQVKPYLKSAFELIHKKYLKSLYLFNIKEADVDPYLCDLKVKYPNVEFGIYPSHGLVGLNLSVYAKHESDAYDQLNEPYTFLAKKFSDRLYICPSGKIEEAVHNLFIEKNITLGLAESCTGGNVAARLIQLPNASQYFLGSIVAYSNELKTKLLDVPATLIQDNGAVSEEVVRAMLHGILAKTNCDFGAAITGIAGPSGGTPEKPVGTVWCAVGKKHSDPISWKIKGYGNREMVINRGVNALLAQLYISARNHE